MFTDKKRKQYCDTLGVPFDADDEKIKRAYKKLALEHHPDRPTNKGKEEDARLKFMKITEAYEKLSNSNNTLNMLKGVFKSSEIHSSLEHFFFTTGSSLNSINISVADLGGGSTANKGSGSFTSSSASFRKGQSLKTTLRIGFQESLLGCTKTIEFTRSILCTQCKGANRNACKDCSGKGFLTATITGGSTITTACPSCTLMSLSGTSPSSLNICTVCKGLGRMTERKTCRVEAPPGVASGFLKTFEGEGDESEEGKSFGDLIVCFEVEQHPFYIRKGDDVHCKLPITFPMAALGSKLEFPSMYGQKLEITIKPGTQHDEILKVEQEGFVNTEKKSRGDLYLQVMVKVPKVLEEKEKEVLHKLSGETNFSSFFKMTLLSQPN